ncbi:MAG: thioredoxin family protein [Candidatus Ozemobacteraceae bacterium]
MIVLTSEPHFKQVFIDEKPTAAILGFFADWCAPSRRQKPLLEALAEEFKGRAVFACIDVDALESLAESFEVRTLPSLALFSKGEHLETLIGFQQDTYIREFLDAIIAMENPQKPANPLSSQ